MRRLLLGWAVVAAACGRIDFQAASDAPGVSCPPGFLDCDGDPGNGCEVRADPVCGGADGCTPATAGTPCGDRQYCDGGGGCSLAVREVGCGGPLTANQLCQSIGFTGATRATGYYWFQCTGFADRICPGTGWDFVNMTCTTWCGNSDCVQFPYCGSGETAYELSGDGTTSYDPLMYGLDCQAFNPGWLVLVRCY